MVFAELSFLLMNMPFFFFLADFGFFVGDFFLARVNDFCSSNSALLSSDILGSASADFNTDTDFLFLVGIMLASIASLCSESPSLNVSLRLLRISSALKIAWKSTVFCSIPKSYLKAVISRSLNSFSCFMYIIC